MTPIIRNNKPITSVRRRLITGVLPADSLLPPSAVFTGDVEEQSNAADFEQLPEIVEDEEPISEVKVSRPSRVRIVPELVIEEEEEIDPDYEPEVFKTKKISKARKIGVNPIEDIMASMRQGEALLLKKDGINSYQLSVIPNDIIVSKTGFQYLKKGITGRQYWDEVLDPAFEVWSKKWNSMTYAEKLKYTKSKKITWEVVPDNPKLDIMRMTEAVRKAENIEKYKPEYKRRSARSKVRG